MKLAEALILRADMQENLRSLWDRAREHTTVQEGDEPQEDPNELIRQYVEGSKELLILIQRINKTNTTKTCLDSDKLISDALAERDHLKSLHSMFTTMASSAVVSGGGLYSRSEIKTVPTVSVSSLRSRADKSAKEIRELDTLIQQTNWMTDLIR